LKLIPKLTPVQGKEKTFSHSVLLREVSSTNPLGMFRTVGSDDEGLRERAVEFGLPHKLPHNQSPLGRLAV
jgi:hypothetical protein